MTEPGVTPVRAARAAERAKRFRQPGPWLRLAVVGALALLPLAAPSFQTLDLVLKVVLFGVLAASYDVALGYTGIVSFGHAMFFGFGAYAVALALGKLGAPTYGHLLLGVLAGAGLSAAVALLIGAFSLRVKAIFFAMITLAFAEFALIVAVQWSPLTGGEDGLSPRVPGIFAPGFAAGRVLGQPVTGRVVVYYTVITACVGLFALMSRFVHSPLGRVLQAVRDNELRAEALGYRTFVYQMVASTFASVVATLLGSGYALWVGYVNPESALGVPIMLDVLLMVVIGGIGTLWGGPVGAAVLVTARTLLPDLRGLGAWLGASGWVADAAQRLTERWLFYFGVLFVLVVFFFPKGVIGTLRERFRPAP